jgi:hypothetical protein
MSSWRHKLRTLLDRFSGTRRDISSEIPESQSAGAPAQVIPYQRQSRPASVSINLGIDFGTSFTKICFRDVGTEESGIVAVGGKFKNGLIPSVVAIGSGGCLCLEDEIAADSAHISIPYLKMRLAGSPIGEKLRSINGIDLNSEACTRALASWFLATVIIRAQQWLYFYECDRLKNRDATWSANVGVPVEHYDSDKLRTFEKVLGVAWLWARRGEIPGTLSETIDAFETTRAQLKEAVTDFHAIPEIAAAVQSFVMSREAVPGIYVYFDIGGGTVDGVAFNFTNVNGERRINFYSGKVEPLGVSAFAATLGAKQADEVELEQLKKIIERAPRNAIESFATRIRNLVGYVVMTAKKKDGRNWQRDAVQDREFRRRFIGSLQPSQMQPLVVFVGGGGCRSEWYRSFINSTHAEYQQIRADVPPYRLLQVPKPKDLVMAGPGDGEFIRFAISYGLSIPFGEGPQIKLPSQFSTPPPPITRKPPGVVDYADTKDVYD